MKESDFEALREMMVTQQLAVRGISDKKVLEAFRKVPRHLFVPEDLQERAYDDYPLPIGSQQTISQPYMVALMTQSLGLKGGERVLEIGTGSGYQTAIISEIAGEVYSVERFESLALQARKILDAISYANCKIKVGDGTLGWEEHAPYDGIIVTAGSPGIPESLAAQLKEGARLVIPIGGVYSQILTVVTREGNSLQTSELCGCMFVPLIGKEGWSH